MKKWLIVVIVVVVIGALAGFFLSQGEASNVETPSPDKEKPVTAGTIQVPDGPKIKVVFNGPSELRADWEKLGMAGFQLQIIGTMTNISEQTVKFSEIAFLLDDQQLAYIPGQTLNPGSQTKIVKGFPGDYENAKVLEIKIKGFEVIDGSAATPEPTTPGAPDQTPVTSGTIQVPNGPKIKVVFNGPPELKAIWEKVGMASDGFQVQLIGTLTNVSGQTVEFSEIEFFFDGRQVDFIEGRTLFPGEAATILKSFSGYTDETKILEIKVKGFEVTEIFGSSFTKEVLENPQGPGEIVAAFYFLLNEKKYSKAAELLTKDSLQLIESKGGLKQGEELFRERQLKQVEFWRVSIDTDKSRASVDDLTLYFTNGDKETYKTSVYLIKEDSGWKMD